jgi:glycerate kinase
VALPAGSQPLAPVSFPASTLSRIDSADLVITGEGLVDATTSTGKVVGRVLARAHASGVEALVMAGDVAVGGPIPAVSLVERYGAERAIAEPAECLAELVETALVARRNEP